MPHQLPGGDDLLSTVQAIVSLDALPRVAQVAIALDHGQALVSRKLSRGKFRRAYPTHGGQMPKRPPVHVPAGSCPQADQRIHRNREHDAWRGSSAARGYGYKWQKARASFLASHPLCTMCEKHGLVTPATVVDHIRPHRGNYDLFWDQDNWQALCKRHHDSDKQVIERGGKPRMQIGSEGWPVTATGVD